jgi:hypothetical protein
MFKMHPAVSCSIVSQYAIAALSPAQESWVYLSMVMAGLKTVMSGIGMSQVFKEYYSNSGLPLGII